MKRVLVASETAMVGNLIQDIIEKNYLNVEIEQDQNVTNWSKKIKSTNPDLIFYSKNIKESSPPWLKNKFPAVILLLDARESEVPVEWLDKSVVKSIIKKPFTFKELTESIADNLEINRSTQKSKLADFNAVDSQLFGLLGNLNGGIKENKLTAANNDIYSSIDKEIHQTSDFFNEKISAKADTTTETQTLSSTDKITEYNEPLESSNEDEMDDKANELSDSLFDPNEDLFFAESNQNKSLDKATELNESLGEPSDEISFDETNQNDSFKEANELNDSYSELDDLFIAGTNHVKPHESSNEQDESLTEFDSHDIGAESKTDSMQKSKSDRIAFESVSKTSKSFSDDEMFFETIKPIETVAPVSEKALSTKTDQEDFDIEAIGGDIQIAKSNAPKDKDYYDKITANIGIDELDDKPALTADDGNVNFNALGNSVIEAEHDFPNSSKGMAENNIAVVKTALPDTAFSPELPELSTDLPSDLNDFFNAESQPEHNKYNEEKEMMFDELGTNSDFSSWGGEQNKTTSSANKFDDVPIIDKNDYETEIKDSEKIMQHADDASFEDFSGLNFDSTKAENEEDFEWRVEHEDAHNLNGGTKASPIELVGSTQAEKLEAADDFSDIDDFKPNKASEKFSTQAQEISRQLDDTFDIEELNLDNKEHFADEMNIAENYAPKEFSQSDNGELDDYFETLKGNPDKNLLLDDPFSKSDISHLTEEDYSPADKIFTKPDMLNHLQQVFKKGTGNGIDNDGLEMQLSEIEKHIQISEEHSRISKNLLQKIRGPK